MRKILQGAAGLVLGLGMFAGVAAAASSTFTCDSNISDTGAGSSNTITCVDKNNNSVKCVNNVVASNSNDQSASSGNAKSSGNTNGGNASSGSASNSNKAVVDVGASCAPAKVSSKPGQKPSSKPSQTVFTVPRSSAQVLGAKTQVSAPAVGAVHAGGGGGASTPVVAIAGLVTSLGAVVTGVVLRKRALAL